MTGPHQGGHFVQMCREHGKVVSQCRCMAPDKTIKYIEGPCPVPRQHVSEQLSEFFSPDPKEDTMPGGPIHFINEARLELPTAQFTLVVLNEFVQGCAEKGFDGGSKVRVTVDQGNQREPGYLRMVVSDR